MKLIVQLALAVLLLIAMAACSKSHKGEVIRSSGDIVTNGPGMDGSVHENKKIFFVLKNINNNQQYILRTAIGETVLSDATTTVVDGTLSIAVYNSLDSYIDSAETIASAATVTSYPNIYEARFIAHSTGDYIVSISGISLSTPGVQFFYDLRLISTDSAVLTAFETSETTTILATSGTITPLTINPGYLNIFSGSSSTITPPGTYPVNLTSSSTTTQGYPQLFIYDDKSLALDKLLYSSYTTSMDFIVTKFDIATRTSSTLPIDPANTLASGMTITGIVFSESGPYIVVKGIISALSYSLNVGTVGP
jgi:hypothetical protein